MSHATVKFHYLYINTVCHWMEDFRLMIKILARYCVEVLKFKFLNLIVLPCPLLYVTSEMLKMDKLFWLLLLIHTMY